MPLKHVCPAPGCTALLSPDIAYCPRHQRSQAERQAAYDHSIRLTRDAKYHAFYRSPEWERVSAYIRGKYHGLCLWSLYHGEIAAADEVHHIEPLKTAWDLRLSVDNLIPLSHAVHMWVEAAYKRGGKEIKHTLREMLQRWRDDSGG